MRINDNDMLLKLYKAQEFKAIANNKLNTLSIMIIPTPRYIKNPEERKSLIEKYHNDLIGGTSGKKEVIC